MSYEDAALIVLLRNNADALVAEVERLTEFRAKFDPDWYVGRIAELEAEVARLKKKS